MFQGYVCTSLRHFENKFYNTEHQQSCVSITAQITDLWWNSWIKNYRSAVHSVKPSKARHTP